MMKANSYLACWKKKRKKNILYRSMNKLPSFRAFDTPVSCGVVPNLIFGAVIKGCCRPHVVFYWTFWYTYFHVVLFCPWFLGQLSKATCGLLLDLLVHLFSGGVILRNKFHSISHCLDVFIIIYNYPINRISHKYCKHTQRIIKI